MKLNLTRKWWKSRRRDDDGFSLPTRDDARPIDTQEQEEMVRAFEQKQAQLSRLWRGVFAAFLYGYSAFLTYSIFQQAWFPWELRYHAYFMDEIQSSMIIFADCLALLACLLAVTGTLKPSRLYRRWMWYSVYVGLLVAVFWLYYMFSLPKFHWDVIFLPFGPLSGAVICIYLDHLLKESLEDIRNLRSYMYTYKAM